MTVKVGVIGAGGIAQLAHLPSYHKIEDVELVGIADTNEELAKTISNKYHCGCYTDFKQMVDKNELDAVSICTPPFARIGIIQYLLENNINILCEKPLANSYQTALEIKRMVERSSVQFMMGFTLRFFDWYQSAFELIQENKLGDVMFASATYASPLPPYSWFFEKAKSGGGVIIDRGAHMIDLVTWLFGIPKKVQACILNKRNMNVEENAFVTLIHEDSISQLVLSYGVNKPRDRIEIYGTACNLIVDCDLGLSLFLPSSENILKQVVLKLPKKAIKNLLQSRGLIKKDEDPYFKEISYFVNCLKEGNKVSPNYLDGFNNIKIIDACYKSIKEEKTMDVM